MSSLDATAANKASYGKLVDTYGNPFEVPDYTIKDIRDAIPKHCFERNGLLGLGYVLRDVACLAATFYIFHNFVTPEYIPSYPARFALWGLYTFLQGLFGTGLWVLAHECGHGAFSPSKTYNNIVGWIVHSALLVPYFSWQMSHSKHHKATGHLERDMVFVPRTREQQATRLGKLVHELSELTEETPIYTLLLLFGQQLIGWPNYLLTNVTGHNYHEKQREGRGKGKHNGLGGAVNHFDPRTPLFENKDAHLVVLSDIGIALTAGALWYLGNNFGWNNLLVWYFLPYLWVNHWLGKCSLGVFITNNDIRLTRNLQQLPSPSFSTPTHLSPTTLVRSGLSSRVPLRPSTASLASSAAGSSTVSSRPMFCTTTSALFPSTMPMRPPRRSSPSWVVTTGRILLTDLPVSSRPCTRALVCASGLSLPPRPRVPENTSSSSATAMVWALGLTR